MPESARNCGECGGPVTMFSGITINGAAYHNHCWDRGDPVPESFPATRPHRARRAGAAITFVEG
jgi:hypothetical protein